MQLLQKVNTFTDAQEDNMWSCKLFESDKQGKLCLFWLLGNMQIFM